MDISKAIEKLKKYNDDKEEKQRKEAELYEQECSKYKNIIQSMTDRLNQILELEKIATKCLDSDKLYEFKHSGKSITFGKDGYACEIGNTQMEVVKVGNKYYFKFPSTQNRLLFMKKFVEDFEIFEKNLIELVDEITN